MTCKECNGVGTIINEDGYPDMCPECKGTGNEPVAIDEENQQNLFGDNE